MLTELLQLNRIRLEQDLSYGRLAALIGLKRQTLFRLLSQDGCTPHDRTRYKIRAFLATRRPQAGPEPHGQHDRWEEVRGQR